MGHEQAAGARWLTSMRIMQAGISLDAEIAWCDSWPALALYLPMNVFMKFETLKTRGLSWFFFWQLIFMLLFCKGKHFSMKNVCRSSSLESRLDLFSLEKTELVTYIACWYKVEEPHWQLHVAECIYLVSIHLFFLLVGFLVTLTDLVLGLDPWGLHQPPFSAKQDVPTQPHLGHF